MGKIDYKRLLQLAQSFPEFVKHMELDCMGYKSVPPHHLRIANDLQNCGEPYIALSVWRRAGKSELLHYYCCWRYLLQPQLQVLVISASTGRAEKFAKQVARLMKRSPYLRHLSPSEIRANYDLSGVTNEWPSMQSVSVLTNFTGFRADLIIADDPLGDKAAQSFANASRIVHALLEVNEVLRRPGSYYAMNDEDLPTWAMPQFLMAYTPHNFAPHNYYQSSPEMPEHIMNSCHQLSFPLVVDAEYDSQGFLVGGTSAWPEEFPWKKIIRDQHLYPSRFALQKQLDASPRIDNQCLIRFNKIISHDDIQGVHEWNLYLDPMSGGLDEMGYVIAGVSEFSTRSDAEGNKSKTVDRVIYVREMGGVSGDPEDAFLEIMNRAKGYNVRFIYADDNRSESRFLAPLIKKHRMNMRYEGFKITVKHGSKADRLKTCIPGAINTEAIEFHTSVLADKHNFEQLSGLRDGFGLPKRDDRLDALDYCIQHLGHRTKFRDSLEEYGKVLGNIFGS